MSKGIYTIMNQQLWRFGPGNLAAMEVVAQPTPFTDICFADPLTLYAKQDAALWVLDADTGVKLGQAPLVNNLPAGYTRMTVAPTGKILFGTDAGQLYEIDPRKTTPTATLTVNILADVKDPALQYNQCHSLCFDPEGVLLGIFTTSGGVIVLAQVYPSGKAATIMPVDKRMSLLVCCGKLYGNAEGELFELDPNLKQITSMGGVSSEFTVAARPGGLYVADQPGNLYLVQPKTGQLLAMGKIDGSPHDLAFADAQSLYAVFPGTQGKPETLVRYTLAPPTPRPGTGLKRTVKWTKQIIGPLVNENSKPFVVISNGLVAVGDKLYAGTGSTGELLELTPNPQNKNCVVKRLGGFGKWKGKQLVCSGDLAHDANGVLYGALHTASSMTTLLAQIDTTNGQANVIGDTGVGGLYGLAFCCGTLYGASGTGRLVKLDPYGGRGTVIQNYGQNWWGMTGRPDTWCC
jgi:hypothetical protein